MRSSTALIIVGLLLIVLPIPILPPFVGAIIGVIVLFLGLFLRVLGL